MEIKITIQDKRPTVEGSPVIVCGNSDYTITFAFDAEWGDISARTARFVYTRDGKVLHEDVVFAGNTVAVPVLSNIRAVFVGVYAGDLRTSVPARIPCDLSILCGTEEPPEPTEDQYNQIIWLLANDKWRGATYTPAVSEAGVVSWTNDQGLPNPEEVDLLSPVAQEIAEAKSFTLAAARENGILANAMQVDLDEPFADANKPRLCISSVTINMPPDCTYGVRQVYHIDPRRMALVMVGYTSESAIPKFWINLFSTSLGRWNGWSELDADLKSLTTAAAMANGPAEDVLEVDTADPYAETNKPYICAEGAVNAPAGLSIGTREVLIHDGTYATVKVTGCDLNGTPSVWLNRIVEGEAQGWFKLATQRKAEYSILEVALGTTDTGDATVKTANLLGRAADFRETPIVSFYRHIDGYDGSDVSITAGTPYIDDGAWWLDLQLVNYSMAPRSMKVVICVSNKLA